jgi:Zn-finger nucleic acid-binding protein
MKCPHCPEATLVMSERQGIEIDYCPQCRGVWLDRGELDKLVERAASAQPAAQPASSLKVLRRSNAGRTSSIRITDGPTRAAITRSASPGWGRFSIEDTVWPGGQKRPGT